MSAQKRKLDEENHAFQQRWEKDSLFTEFKGKPLCLVCLETSAMKDFNLSRHYNTTHKDKYEKYTGAARAAIVADLKGKLNRQQCLFTKTTTTQESSLKASYAVSLELAKAKKPLSDGEIVKRCAVEMAKAFGDDNMAKNFETVSLSRRTVTRRIFDIQNHVMSCQLVSLHDTTKGQDIFNAVENVVSEHGGFDKLSAVVTDGAPSMQGKRTGFVGLLQQSGIDCPILHCIIHQEALCAKSMNFSHVMDLVTKVTNLIRGGNRSLNHRKFVAFLDEVSAAYGDLQMHTEIRWMSHRKCLERFFALHAEISVFLEDSIRCDTSAFCSKLRDKDFLRDMAFLADITSHLNHLNMQLQGRGQTVSDLYAHMNAFQSKLALFKEGFSSKSPNLAHFPSCEEMRKDAPECEKIFLKYRADIEALQQQFKNRFQDFYAMQPRIVLFTDPLSAAVSQQPPELQLELCELQSDPFFQAKRHERGISFWRLLPESRFPLLRDFALSMASIFGSTYICESNFSTMKHIKSKERNRLSDETLFQLMQIGCTNIDIDIQSIVRQQERPQVSH